MFSFDLQDGNRTDANRNTHSKLTSNRVREKQRKINASEPESRYMLSKWILAYPCRFHTMKTNQLFEPPAEISQRTHIGKNDKLKQREITKKLNEFLDRDDGDSPVSILISKLPALTAEGS